MDYPISPMALDYVRRKATSVMRYQCRIERVTKPSFDQVNRIAIPGSKQTIYEGICRIWEVAGQGPIQITDDDVVMQSTQLSIPWETSPVPRRDDEVQILAAPTDPEMVGKRFVIDSSAKAGELRATRRFSVRGYQKS